MKQLVPLTLPITPSSERILLPNDGEYFHPKVWNIMLFARIIWAPHFFYQKSKERKKESVSCV